MDFEKEMKKVVAQDKKRVRKKHVIHGEYGSKKLSLKNKRKRKIAKKSRKG